MGLRVTQLHPSGDNNAVLIGSQMLARSRSAERSSSRNSSCWDGAEGVAHSKSDESDDKSGNLGVSTNHLQRSNSDPFDDAGDELLQVPGLTEAADRHDSHKGKALPTLYRFPCTETRNQNCWSETPNKMFFVRGPHYMEGDKTKIPSKQYLFQARGCDLFLTSDHSNSTTTVLQAGLGGNIRKKPTYIFRFLFPWGMLIQYYEVPPKLVPFMKMGMTREEKRELSIKGFTNAEKSLARWMASDDPEFKNDHLKLIAIVPDGSFLVRNLVTGKPALIGKRLQVSYKYVPKQSQSSECIQICDLDISSGTTIAKKAVSVTRRYLSSLKAVDVGFVIEGKTRAELPEEMMGSTRLHQVDPTQAPSI